VDEAARALEALLAGGLPVADGLRAQFDDEVVAATWVVDGSGVYGSIDLRHEATLRIVVIAARHGIADFGSTGMIGWIEVHKSVLARLEHS
jgi:hypothetical protein